MKNVIVFALSFAYGGALEALVDGRIPYPYNAATALTLGFTGFYAVALYLARWNRKAGRA